MLLRTYRATDLEAMYALDVVCFAPPFRFSRSAMRRFAEAKRARVVIAEEDDSVVGFVILHVEGTGQERVGYIVTLDVSPEFRRRGIAKVLMLEVQRLAQADECVALVLHVFTGNESALRFYTNEGFARSHREEEFYGPGRDAWVFHKLLFGDGE